MSGPRPKVCVWAEEAYTEVRGVPPPPPISRPLSLPNNLSLGTPVISANTFLSPYSVPLFCHSFYFVISALLLSLSSSSFLALKGTASRDFVTYGVQIIQFRWPTDFANVGEF